MLWGGTTPVMCDLCTYFLLASCLRLHEKRAGLVTINWQAGSPVCAESAYYVSLYRMHLLGMLSRMSLPKQ